MKPKLSKRERLSSFLLKSGLWHLGKMRFTRRLVVFAYHRLLQDEQSSAAAFDSSVFGPTVSDFGSQVSWLKHHSDLLSESEFRLCVQNPKSFPKLATMITFDDGYRDNFTLAYPVLSSERCAAIFFIPPDLIERRKVGWWDTIAYLVKQTRKSKFEFHVELYSLIDGRFGTIRLFQERMKIESALKTGGLIDELAAVLEVQHPPDGLQDQQLMAWEEIRAMAAAGMGIGAHGFSHRVLATLEPEGQRQELELAKALLEKRLGHKVRSLAYPVGGYAHFDWRTKQIAREVGFELAFSYGTGDNRMNSLDLFDIRRVEGPKNSAMVCGPLVSARLWGGAGNSHVA